MPNILKVAYADGGEDYHDFLSKLLVDYYDLQQVNYTENPDLVICSTFGLNILPDKFRHCKTLWITGENDYPDFNRYDYCISTHYIDFYRHCRMPFFVTRGQYKSLLFKDFDYKYDESMFNRLFCSAVISNSVAADPRRHNIFNAISKYKPVHSAGKAYNNVGKLDDITKMEDMPKVYLHNFTKHCYIKNFKFNLAFENSVVPGYVTEKILDAFIAKTIPIYFGTASVVKEFNKDAFINALDFNTIDDLIAVIKRIDENKDLYMKMLTAPKIKDDTAITFNSYLDNVRKFLLYVISHSKQTCDYGWLKSKNKIQ